VNSWAHRLHTARDHQEAGVAEIGQQLGAATLTWRIKEQSDFTLVELAGELSESADLDRLRHNLKSHAVVLHLAGVRRINSGGVREWVNFIDALTSTAEVTLSHCSPAVVAQLNMIFNFCGQAKVRSILAPYACSRCDREEERVVDLETHFPERDYSQMPHFSCSACGAPMDFDEVVDRYLSFLQEE
jgi:anti-anti-sigma regulatory factor